MPETQQKKKPVVRRRGNDVIVPVAIWDDLMTRLIVAEANAEHAKRSWWRP